MPGSPKSGSLRSRVNRTVSFFDPNVDRPADQYAVVTPSQGSAGAASTPAPAAPVPAVDHPDPSIELGFEELYDVFDLTDEDDTEAMRRAIAVAVVDGTHRGDEEDGRDGAPFDGSAAGDDSPEPVVEAGSRPAEPLPDEDWMGFEPVSLEPVTLEPDEPTQGESFALEPMGFEPVWAEPAAAETLEEDVEEQAPEPTVPSCEMIELESAEVESVVDEPMEVDAAELESAELESLADEVIELPPEEVASVMLDATEAEPLEIESVQIDLGELESEADEAVAEAASMAVDSAEATNPFLTESSTSSIWPPPSLVEALAAEPETVPMFDPQARRELAAAAEEVPSAPEASVADDDGPALPRKTPVLEMAFDDLQSEPGEPPPASAERLVEEAFVPAPELPSRPGSIVPVGELDDAPPLGPAPATMVQLAQAADAAPTVPPPSPESCPRAGASPPPPPVRRAQNTTAAWPPPLPVEVPDEGPSPRTGQTLAGLCPKAPFREEPLLAAEDVPPPIAKVIDSEPPPPAERDVAAASPVVAPEPTVIINEAVTPPDVAEAQPAELPVDRGLVGLRPSAVEVRAATELIVPPSPATGDRSETASDRAPSNITRERRRVEGREEEHHRQSLGYESTMPYSWVTVPALESSPALPLVEKPSAVSLAPTALPELPSLAPLSRSSWRSGAQWLAVAAMVVGMALLTWQLLPREGSLRIALSEPVGAAAVYVDGAKKCDVLPCELADVRPGARVITVMAPGFERSQTVASVLAGELIEVTLPVKALPPPPEPTVQGLRATSAQRGVEVFVDGKRRGELPIELKDLTPGQHTVLFSAGDRYAALEQVVELGADTIEDLGAIELTLLRGVLTLEVRTPRTRVLLGTKGKRSSQKDLRGPWPKELELEPGHYDVIGAKEGYLPVSYSVAVDAKHPEPHVVIDLEPDPNYYTLY
ncbi:MAG: PEGA domain-containing protein [Deltaproteobacteria bacterium]|nr:PEGA domain-containing protein [Deltaproteobacteria bacterium]